jgi:chromosome segregation ATPase
MAGRHEFEVRRTDISEKIRKAYATMQNLMATVPGDKRPKTVAVECFSSDTEALAEMQRVFTRLTETIEANLKEKSAVDRQLADRTQGYKERKAKRQSEIKELESKIKALREREEAQQSSFIERGIVEDDDAVAEKRREELAMKLQRWRVKEAELKTAVDFLKRENGETIDVDFLSPAEPLDDMIEEINLITEANENLKAHRENLELKHAEIQLYLDEIQVVKSEIMSEKGDLGKKINQMKHKNKKDESRLWELLATHEALYGEIQSIDKEMENLRDENQTIEAETDQLEMLAKGLDEQEQINIMLEEKLRVLTAKLTNHPVPQDLLATPKSNHEKSVTKLTQASMIAPTSKSSSIIKKNFKVITELEKKAQMLKQVDRDDVPLEYDAPKPHAAPQKKPLMVRLKSLQ